VNKGFQLFFCNKKNEFTASKRTHHFLMFSASAQTVFLFYQKYDEFYNKKNGSVFDLKILRIVSLKTNVF